MKDYVHSTFILVHLLDPGRLLQEVSGNRKVTRVPVQDNTLLFIRVSFYLDIPFSKTSGFAKRENLKIHGFNKRIKRFNFVLVR